MGKVHPFSSYHNNDIPQKCLPDIPPHLLHQYRTDKMDCLLTLTEKSQEALHWDLPCQTKYHRLHRPRPARQDMPPGCLSPVLPRASPPGNHYAVLPLYWAAPLPLDESVRSGTQALPYALCRNLPTQRHPEAPQKQLPLLPFWQPPLPQQAASHLSDLLYHQIPVHKPHFPFPLPHPRQR